MRSLGRWPLYGAVTFLTVLFLLAVFKNSEPLSTHLLRKPVWHYGSEPPSLDSLPETVSFENIDALWHIWSKIMWDTRPKSPKLGLIASAPNIGVNSQDQTVPRAPYMNLIANGQEDIDSMRLQHARLLKELSKLGPLSTLFNGYGVTLVGGGEYFGPAITTIQMLRKTGCQLPVEVFVADDTEHEKYVCEEYLPKLNAKCLVVTDFLAKGSHKFLAKHYQLKALALLFSSFQHTLFLDSDSIPLVDPYAHLLKSEPYLSKGLIVWPDFWKATESPYLYQIAGLSEFPAGLPMTSSETGQIVINKGTHLPALLLAVYYNLYGPDHYYPLLSQGAAGQGDKETFMAAAVVLRSPFYRVKAPVSAVMNDDGIKTKGRAMLQSHPIDDYENVTSISPDGSVVRQIRPAFLHANLPKMNAGHLVDEGDLFSEVDRTQRWRLLGTKENQVRIFGFDIEAALWELMVQTGCELAHQLNDWKPRQDLCTRLKTHAGKLFP